MQTEFMPEKESDSQLESSRWLKWMPQWMAVVALATVAIHMSSTPAQAQVYEQSAAYVSQVDEDLTIRRVTILPVIDNLEGIYSRPIEAQLISLTQGLHRWDYVESKLADGMPSLSELEENPAMVQKLVQGIEVDAIITAAASRGPNGLSIRLNLFLKKDGRLLSQEVLRDHPKFQIADLRNQVNQLYRKLIAKIPYDGLILSRQQNRVTINLGKSDGLAKDKILTAIQIISVERHPRFHFLISSEKAILGRVKILKVDDTLSFGAIISEKEKGAIQRFAKIAGVQDVQYPAPESLDRESGAAGLASRPDADVTFGKNPNEWLPTQPPSFGQVGLKVGFGSFTSSVNLDTVGTLEAKSSFYPSLGVHGELWLNPNWIVRAELTQGIISTSNPRSGSSPSELNHSVSRYSMLIGYNFLLRDDFFGPKFQLSAGFGTSRIFVDDSQPQSLTTTNYSGLLLGLSGSFPVTDEKLWYLGGNLNLYLMPKLSESPVSSGGSPKNTINDFSLFVERKIGENLKATASIDFALYTTNFSGTGTRAERATSLSQRTSNVTAGVVYMF